MVAAAVVTTHTKPHAQQQLARDLEVERAAMGPRCRPQSSGPGLLRAAARFGFDVKNNLSLLEGLDFTPAASATTCLLYTSPSPRDQRGSRMPSSA